MDTGNPVVKRCVEGMQAEAEDRMADAASLFFQAWEIHQDDFEACIAAHFVARHQASPADALRWNQAALDHANAAPGDQVQGFYPSLYLNLGWSFEALGNIAAARNYYELASAEMDALPDGPYRNKVKRGVTAARDRTA